jgi:hypothetical protein
MNTQTIGSRRSILLPESHAIVGAKVQYELNGIMLCGTVVIVGIAKDVGPDRYRQCIIRDEDC